MELTHAFDTRREPRLRTVEAGRTPLLASMYLRQMWANLLFCCLGYAGALVLLLGKLPYSLDLVWAALFGIFLGRGIWRRQAGRSEQLTPERARKLLDDAPLLAAITGVFWGVTALALPYLADAEQITLTVLVLALIAASASTLSAVPRASVIFMALAGLPFLAAYLLQPTAAASTLAVLGVGYLLTMLISLRINAASLQTEVAAHEEAQSARQEALSAEAALQESQSLWREFSHSAEAFALYDEAGDLILWNEAYRKLLDIRPNDLHPGMSFRQLESPNFQQLAENRLLSGQSRVPDDFTETAEIGGRWFRTAVGPLSNGHLAVTHVDVTSLKENEGKLLALQDVLVNARNKAEAANAAKSDFLGKMSHELRTPLNAVIGFADLIVQDHERGRVDARRHSGYARLISDSGRHLLAIVEDLLDVTRIESGTMMLRETEIDLRELLHSAGLIVEGRQDEPRVQLEERFPPHPVVALVDQRLMRQAVLNLLENAAKFSTEAPRIGIAIDCRQDGGADIRVEDNGIGIPAEMLDAVKGPFVQVENSETRRYGGVGLGLSLVGQFAELHGGALRLERRPEGGTAAILQLPARRVLSAA